MLLRPESQTTAQATIQTMPAAIPKPVTNDLLSDLQALMNAGHILGSDDPDLLRIAHKARGLQCVDVWGYYAVQSAIETVRGNRDKAESAIESARNVGLDPVLVSRAKIITNLKLLFASDAQKAISEYLGTAFGGAHRSSAMEQEVQTAGLSLLATGAFQELDRLFLDEPAMLGDSTLRLAGVARGAAALLRDQGVDDATCAKVVDTAGEVMRKHKLMWIGGLPDLIVDHDASTVGLHFTVDTTVTEALDMMDEVTDRLIDRNLDAVPLLVLFRGVKV